MDELILHHYDLSPFSEKVRLVLGLKRLPWRSVIVPMILPKPDLMPLTGGFRRTPVLQIGADVYCDTNLIAAELERRFPEPTIFPDAGLSAVLSMWADRVLFWPTARYVTAVNSERLPDAFHADRAAMRGHAVIDPRVMQAEAPHHRQQLLLQLDCIEHRLRDGTPFLLGDRPSLADFAVYARVWWLGAFGDHGLPLGPQLAAWTDRIASIGHGRRTEMPAGEALARAAAAEPRSGSGDDAADPLVGRRVSVSTEGAGPDPVTGEVVFASRHEVALRRADDRVGEIVVHFPRLGYEIRPV